MTDSLRWRWLQAVATSDLPSTSRLVAHTLALHMNTLGANCFPGIGTICSESGLGRTAVCRHLDSLEELGWLHRERDRRPSGAWGRTTYLPAIPPEHVVREENDVSGDVVREENDHAPKGEGVVPLTGGVVPLANEGRSSEYPPRRSPRERETVETDRETDRETDTPTEGAADAAGSWVQEGVRIWKERMGGNITHGRLGAALKSVVDEHGEKTVLRVFDWWLADEVNNGRARFATPEGLARTFGAEKERMANGKGGVLTTTNHEDLAAWKSDIGRGQGEFHVERGRPEQ